MALSRAEGRRQPAPRGFDPQTFRSTVRGQRQRVAGMPRPELRPQRRRATSSEAAARQSPAAAETYPAAGIACGRGRREARDEAARAPRAPTHLARVVRPGGRSPALSQGGVGAWGGAGMKWAALPAFGWGGAIVLLRVARG